MNLQQQALQKLITSCPMCSAPKEMMHFKLVKQTTEAEFLHIHCALCQGSVVALVMTSGSLISSIGLVTDLTEADAQRLHTAKAISEDDILQLHQALQHQDFCQALLTETINH